MGEENEVVQYSFQGDVRSLKQATQTAIQLLNDYQQVVKKAVDDGKFSASARATTTFNNAIAKTSKDVEKLASKLKSVGDVKLPLGSSTSDAFAQTLLTVTKQMDSIANATKLTTKDLTGLKSALNASRSSLTSTSGEVDKLVASEQRFQNVLGAVNTKAETVRNVMDNLRTRMSGTFDPVTSKIKALSSVFDSINAKIQGFKDKASTAFSRVGALADAVASAFRRTSVGADDSDAAASRSARSHKSLGSILSNLASVFRKETRAIDTEEEELESKNNTLKKSSSSHRSLIQVLIQLGNRFKAETSRVNNFTAKLLGANGASGLLRRGLTALTGIKLGQWLAESAKQSINYIENLNLFTVAMGDAVEEGTRFVGQMQEIYGMDPSNLMRYAGNFYQLATAIEMPDAAATNLSLVLTKASNDIASLFNMPIETVFENMSSGMQGMSRAVRKYGMDIRVTTLQTEAAALGITAQVESMSEANRMGLRFLAMMKQGANAAGDFARTIETPSNQLRIFKEQMAQLGRAIGDFFIGPLGRAIAYVNGFIMALRTVLTFIGQLVGVFSGVSTAFDVSSAEAEADALADVGKAAGGAADNMQKLIAPFDELNVLSEQDSGGGGGSGALGEELMDPRIAEAIAGMSYEFEKIQMKANQVRDALLEFFGFNYDFDGNLGWDASVFEQNLINKFPGWTKTIQSVFKNWSAIVGGFKNVFGALGQVFGRIKDRLSDFLSVFINDDTVSSFIDGLADSLNNLASWISEHSQEIADFVLILGGLWAAFKVFAGVASFITPILEFVSAFGPLLSIAAPVVGQIAAIIGIITLLYLTCDSFAQACNEIWGLVTNVITDSATMIWSVIKRIVSFVVEIIQGAIKVIDTLWSECIGPIISHIVEGLGELWEGTIKPIIQNVIDIIIGVMDIVSGLWNNVLVPILQWLIKTLGPSIKNIVNTIWDVVSGIFQSIGGVIDGLLEMLGGLIDFLAGVFTGDWQRAWKGIVNIFIGLGNSIISAFEFVVNAVIGLINGMISLVYNGVVALVNSVLSAVEGIADLVGVDLDLRITAPPPAIPTQKWGRIPELASGGVVSSPTYALVGEGAYSEAVVPLDNSPEMQELVKKIADAVDKRDSGGGSPTEVHVYIGGKEYDAFTYRSSERGRTVVGKQPIKKGG